MLNDGAPVGEIPGFEEQGEAPQAEQYITITPEENEAVGRVFEI